MKKAFKRIWKIIIYLLLFIALLIVSIVISRKSNQSKIDEVVLAFKTHPKLSEVNKMSPNNIGVIRRKFIGDNIRGFHHIPHEIRHNGVVVTFGGSEGTANDHMAYYLASDGYEVISVYFFGQKDQPENVEKIPLELYEETYSYAKENCQNLDTITLLGSSKGAQSALLLSTYYDTIDNLVLFAPSSYITGSSLYAEVSPWTYEGKELDYLNGNVGVVQLFDRIISVLTNKPLDQLKAMNVQLKNSTNIEEARIKVENSNAKILIFYGEDDRAFDSKLHSDVIKEYTKNEIIIHGYANTGHSFGGPTISIRTNSSGLNGGDLDSNIEADLDSKRILLETLELWHK